MYILQSRLFLRLFFQSVYTESLPNEDITQLLDLYAEPNNTVLDDINSKPTANLYLLFTSLKGEDAGMRWNIEANNLVFRISNSGVTDVEQEMSSLRLVISVIGCYVALNTRQNPNVGEVLIYNNVTSVTSSNFNPSAPTVVVVHGWLENEKSDLNPTIKNALLESTDVNVIIMDWSRLSRSSYVTAVRGVPAIGQGLGKFLAFLNETTGISYDLMHLAGFSLGAHVVGNAGRILNGQVSRVTGLDPAGPLWYNNKERLRSTDARYVEAIHTNAGGLGIKLTVGDVDFIPNGGSSQPGCVSSMCNHNRSWKLFASSLNHNHLAGNQCSSAYQLSMNACRGTSFPLGNNDLSKFGTGVYRLKTGSKYPY